MTVFQCYHLHRCRLWRFALDIFSVPPLMVKVRFLKILRTPRLAATLAAITVKLIFVTLHACGRGPCVKIFRKFYSLLLNGVVLGQSHKQLQNLRKIYRTQNTGSGTNRFHSPLFWIQAAQPRPYDLIFHASAINFVTANYAWHRTWPAISQERRSSCRSMKHSFLATYSSWISGRLVSTHCNDSSESPAFGLPGLTPALQSSLASVCHSSCFD